MRIAITTVQVPFVSGGAEYHANGLLQACKDRGHDAEIVTTPFRFDPAQEVFRSINFWETVNFQVVNYYYNPDIVMCLKFPTYYLKHYHKVVWLLHQHRDVYDLWDVRKKMGCILSKEDDTLKSTIAEKDKYYLENCHALFTNSVNVSNRLKLFSGLSGTALYHPPPLANEIYSAETSQPFIFAPGRLEPFKRIDLLIDAMRLVGSNVKAVIVGDGSMDWNLQDYVVCSGLQDRVQFLGWVSKKRLIDLYANCMCVFFGPYDEDYGYITLEAMLASKPVITCTDSGGPLEFVIHEETGYVVEPCPEAVADAIEKLCINPEMAQKMGKAGYDHYQGLDLSWQHVLDCLLC
ncbi:MAG: glycosyltransferase family 4 protein [Desulfobacterales bacterium]|nr:glycosyltransferase family 4 protein [Desulfobacterales bacterium]